jgi:hypothetical protein
MPGTLVITTLSDGTNSTSATNCIQGSAKVWVNFDGTTSPGTIRAQYNVSSITKTSTGQYTVNFTNAFADANYAPLGTAEFVGGASPIVCISDYLYGGAPTTTACKLFVRDNFGNYVDVVGCYVAIFR